MTNSPDENAQQTTTPIQDGIPDSTLSSSFPSSPASSRKPFLTFNTISAN